jgi:hypothetical protein
VYEELGRLDEEAADRAEAANMSAAAKAQPAEVPQQPRNAMRTVYRVLAYAIAALVAIQAAAIGYAVFAQLKWIENGGTLDKASVDTAPGTGALMFHALDGGIVLLAAIALLVVSFFAKIPQGVRWSVIVLVSTIVQIALGTLSYLFTEIGAVHGAVALVLFGLAVMAAMRARTPVPVGGEPTRTQVPVAGEPVPTESGGSILPMSGGGRMSDPYRGRWTRDEIEPSAESWYLNDTSSRYVTNAGDRSWRIFKEENPEYFEGGVVSHWLGEPQRIFYRLIRDRWSIVLDAVEAKALDIVVAHPSGISRAELYRTLIKSGAGSVPIVYEKVGNILQMRLIRSLE